MVEALAPVVDTQEVGMTMPDGTIYAGMSPDTKKPMYVTAADAPVSMDFNQAAKYAKALDAHGHKDWRVPSITELSVIHKNLEKGALKGTFNLTTAYPKGQYWSSTGGRPDSWIPRLFSSNFAWIHRFGDGLQLDPYQGTPASVRCVR